MSTTTRGAFGVGALLVPFLLLLPGVASAQAHHGDPGDGAFYAAEGSIAGPGGAATFELEALSTDDGGAAYTTSVTYAGLGGAGTYEVGAAAGGHDDDVDETTGTAALWPTRAPANAAPEARPAHHAPDAQPAEATTTATPVKEAGTAKPAEQTETATAKPVEQTKTATVEQTEAARPNKEATKAKEAEETEPVEADEPVTVPMETSVRPSPSYAAYHHSATHAGWGGAGSHEVAALAGEYGALYHASGTQAGLGGAGSFSVTSGSTR